MEKKHVLLYGERGVGKSTMIEKLLQICTVPVYGFVTKATPAVPMDIILFISIQQAVRNGSCQQKIMWAIAMGGSAL